MFEATLHAADPDRQRQQRLLLAAAIAISSTMTAFASVWTLERFDIDRVIGPNQQFELLEFSMLTPPKPVDPPPPPPPDGTRNSIEATGAAVATTNKAADDLEDDPAPSDTLTQPRRSDSIPGGPSIPGQIPGVSGCPGGICSGISPLGPAKPCTGPLCTGTADPSKPSAAPAEVEFSALRCIACADPDQTTLRKTVAAGQKRAGRVEVKFCVDAKGRVEGNSIKVSRSFGLPAVDQIMTSTLERWRFSPLEVAGKPRRACSRAVFNIRFE